MIIKIYQDEYGNEPFNDWLKSIKDFNTKIRILSRLERIKIGNFGDHRSIGEGLYELRLHFGSGYRVYYGQIGDEIVLLLAGGDKSTQKQDIQKAKHYWHDHKWSQKNETI
jgi:putative addiction module killer protein